MTTVDSRTFKLRFPVPTHIGIQDNRRWGGKSFTIRVGQVFGKLTPASPYSLALSFELSGKVEYRNDEEVVILPGQDWVPLTAFLDIVPGSALDLSGILPAKDACGSKGRVIATPDGHFAFADEPSTPQRFYGPNLCFSSQFMSKENVDILLDRWVRMGYNTLRIHHYEFGLTTPIWKSGFDWDARKLDQLCYLIAGCAKRGIWITTDLYVSRPVAPSQIGVPAEKPYMNNNNAVDMQMYKALVPVHEPAYQDFIKFTGLLLNHVNPYTGKRLAEEPALAWLSLLNEGAPGDRVKMLPQWKVAWNQWLGKRYPTREALAAAFGDLKDGEDAKAGTVEFPADSVLSDSPRGRVCQVFLASTETAFVERTRKYLRDELKCPALLTNHNCPPNTVPDQGARNSEFNFSGPGRYRGVGTLMTGALAAIQDWDAIWRFAYAHTDKEIFTPSPIDYFNIVRDPLSLAADRAAVMLYLRGDMKPAPRRVALEISPSDLEEATPTQLTGVLSSLAWTTRVGTAIKSIPADAIVIPFRGEEPDPTKLAAGGIEELLEKLVARGIPIEKAARVLRAETGELTLDKANGVLTVDTPRTAGGYADPGRTIDASQSGVKVDEVDTGATVFVTSLDGQPIRNAARLLVTHLTDLQNSGAHYGESARQTLLSWGGLPYLVRSGQATVHLALAEPKAYSVWEVSVAGHRIAPVPSTVENGTLRFTATVRGAYGARMLYEITTEAGITADPIVKTLKDMQAAADAALDVTFETPFLLLLVHVAFAQVPHVLNGDISKDEPLPLGLEPHGADVIDISPVTDRILLVKFSEGTIEPSLFNDMAEEPIFHYSLLDVKRAANTANYRISSADDPAFRAGVHPVNVGRKSKGRHFSKDLHVFRKGKPSDLSELSLYLQLPSPLVSGRSYTLALDGLATSGKPWNFKFNETTMRSEAIHVNQLGYRPDASKFAYISQFMGDFDAAPHLQGGLDLNDFAGGAFKVVRADNGQTVFSGTLGLQKEKTKSDVTSADYGPNGNMTQADVWQADFSEFKTPGRYRIVVARMGCSPDFEIQDDIYRRAYVAAMRGLFFQRAGIEKQVRELGDLIYPADYVTNAMYYLPDVGRQEAGKVSNTSRPVTGIWGWYHDAGDWDGYARHTGVPASLLLAYELSPEKFGDGDIGNRWRRLPSDKWVDEGQNGIPDILDEAGWLLSCYRRARHALIDQCYGSGGVPAYMGIDACGKASASWLDERALVVHGEDAKLTAEYAGLAAWYASALMRTDCSPEAAIDWMGEACDSYRWAEAHGGLDGEEGWLANAGLYRATGDAQYQKSFLDRFNPKANWEYWGGADAKHFALLLYAVLPTNHPNLILAEQGEKRRLVANTADAFWVKNGMTRGFRATHIAGYQRLFLGALSTPRTLFPMVAHSLTGEKRFADAVQFAADYTLGGNQMNLICMSGLGPTSEDAVFHPDSWALLAKRRESGCLTLPGLTPFGANFTFDWFGANYQFSGSEDFSRSTAYPVIWRKSGSSFGGMGPAWKHANEIPKWAPPDSLGEGPENKTLFPAGEQRFPNRFSIPGSEFTVNQTLCHTAFTYASLIAGFQKFEGISDKPVSNK